MQNNNIWDYPYLPLTRVSLTCAALEAARKAPRKDLFHKACQVPMLVAYLTYICLDQPCLSLEIGAFHKTLVHKPQPPGR